MIWPDLEETSFFNSCVLCSYAFCYFLNCKRFLLYNNAVRSVISEGWHLITCGKHLYDRIVLLRGKFWANETRFIPPLFIEVSVPTQESE